MVDFILYNGLHCCPWIGACNSITDEGRMQLHRISYLYKISKPCYSVFRLAGLLAVCLFWKWSKTRFQSMRKWLTYHSNCINDLKDIENTSWQYPDILPQLRDVIYESFWKTTSLRDYKAIIRSLILRYGTIKFFNKDSDSFGFYKWKSCNKEKKAIHSTTKMYVGHSPNRS